MMIYAILAVEYFAPLGQEFGEHPYGTYVTFGDGALNHSISAETPRGFTCARAGLDPFGPWAMACLMQLGSCVIHPRARLAAVLRTASC